MRPFTDVGSIASFPSGRGRSVVVEGERVAVFRDGARIVAVENRCPHEGAPLEHGTLVDGAVECSWHRWRFDAATGKGTSRTGASVRVYEARIEGDRVLLRPPEPMPDRRARGEEEDWVPFDPARHLKPREPHEPGEPG